MGQQWAEVLEEEGQEKQDSEGVSPGGNEEHPAALTNSLREVLRAQY